MAKITINKSNKMSFNLNILFFLYEGFTQSGTDENRGFIAGF